RQRVYIALYQSHLPKLDEEGVIDYNQSRGIVERGSLADQFDPYLEARSDDGSEAEDDDDDERWFRYYRWATAASAGTLAATWLGLPLVGSVTSSVLGALVVCTYAAIATVQLARQ
uniref:DUF7344 domain-containing protein n=1 Tax=Halomicrococcus sp. SG-WS-1 TaxID=3439057 RepID=UPI003F79622F